MNHSLFVYGTLMIPEIQQALLQKKVKSKDAILNDFSANCILYGQYITEYPFLKPNKGSVLFGKLLYPLSGQDLSLIKYYEGSEYVLSDIRVKVDGMDTDVKTFMLKKREQIEYGPKWEINNFKKNYLFDYVNKVIPELLIHYNM